MGKKAKKSPEIMEKLALSQKEAFAVGHLHGKQIIKAAKSGMSIDQLLMAPWLAGIHNAEKPETK